MLLPLIDLFVLFVRNLGLSFGKLLINPLLLNGHQVGGHIKHKLPGIIMYPEALKHQEQVK
jgi:hypothetical protein